MPGCVEVFGRRGVRHPVSQDVIGIATRDGWTMMSTGRRSIPIAKGPCLVVVADGLGAHPIGRTAAAVVVTGFLRHVAAEWKSDTCNSVALATSQRLRNISRRRGFRRCAGAAVAGVIIDAERFVAFSAGDVGVFAQAGDGSRRRIFEPERNAAGRLLNCLGGDYDDVPYLQLHEGNATQTTIICTDGVWESAHFAEPDPRDLSEKLTTGSVPDDDCALALICLD